MATSNYPINPSVYSGGAVQFNSMPFMQFYAMQQNRKQQKEQALDKYYADQMNAITPTGVRAKDIEGGWGQKFERLQRMGIENRDMLLRPSRDGYRTLNEFNRLKNELLLDAQRSKEAAKSEDVLRGLKTSGKWNPTDDDFEIAEDMSLSIYDPRRRGLGVDGLSVNMPPFDPGRFMESVQKGFKRGKVELSRIPDSNAGIQTITEEEQFSPREVMTMAERAAMTAQSDRSARANFQRMMNGDMLPQLQQAFSSVYPDGGFVDSPEKAAAAYTILNSSAPTARNIRTEKYEDPALKVSRQKEIERFRHGLRVAEINLRKKISGSSEQGRSSALDEFISGLEKSAEESDAPDFVRDATGFGGGSSVKRIPMSPSISKAFERSDIYGEKVQPDEVIITDKGEYRPMFYKRRPVIDEKTKEVLSWEEVWGPNGQKEVDERLSRPIPRGVFKAELSKVLLTPKLVEENMRETTPTTKPPSAAPKKITPTKGMFD